MARCPTRGRAGHRVTTSTSRTPTRRWPTSRRSSRRSGRELRRRSLARTTSASRRPTARRRRRGGPLAPRRRLAGARPSRSRDDARTAPRCLRPAEPGDARALDARRTRPGGRCRSERARRARSWPREGAATRWPSSTACGVRGRTRRTPSPTMYANLRAILADDGSICSGAALRPRPADAARLRREHVRRPSPSASGAPSPARSWPSRPPRHPPRRASARSA